ncbi:hypothetical protein ACFPOB_15880 [Bosea eneae]|uniref:Uncharacterized protein n=1 Tax=Bosea eneae TaxID=151454 RepID=A0ABW0IRU7_9HYPH
MARDRIIEVVIARHLSPEARAAKLAAFAKEKLAEAQAAHRARRGTVPPHETIVDHRRGASVDSVKPDGEIVFEFELIRTTLLSIADMLAQASPVLTGEYRRSHILFADGQETTPESAPAAAQEFAFVNVTPYARRIEAGISKAAPEGVYQAVADIAAKRFGNVARVRFTFRSVTSGRAKADRQPAITIIPR